MILDKKTSVFNSYLLFFRLFVGYPYIRFTFFLLPSDNYCKYKSFHMKRSPEKFSFSGHFFSLIRLDRVCVNIEVVVLFPADNLDEIRREPVLFEKQKSLVFQIAKGGFRILKAEFIK